MNGTKRALREAATVARLRLSPEERAAHSHVIAERVIALDLFERAHTLALYAPIGAEVDTAEIARAALARGKRIAYPRLVGGQRRLAFAACAEDALRPGALGTREPPAEAAPVPVQELDAVLVPGVAFDARCWRLGRGGGYYDATLAGLPTRSTKVGLAFEVQIVPAVPRDGHDLPVDVVVSEAAVRLRAGGSAPSIDTSH